MIWQLLVAGLLGGAVGATELAARYRDDPVAALRTLPGVVYVIVNIAAAVAALVIVKAFGWTFGLASDASALQVQVVQVLVAGVGSAALFRSSLFTVHQGDQEIGIGPSALLASLLGLVDRGVDRQRALERLGRDDLAGLSFDRDYVALTELCTGALQNLDKAEAQGIGELAARLKEEPGLSDTVKLDCFALEMLTLVGPKAIQAAAQRLRERRAAESAESVATALPDAALPAEDGKAWRERAAVLDELVKRPAGKSRQLEPVLELAWLNERLARYGRAAELYMELVDAVRNMSPVLTDHELLVAWARTQMPISEMYRKGEEIDTYSWGAPDSEPPWRGEDEVRKARRERVDECLQKVRVRLDDMCRQTGGHPGSYVAALYIFATHLPVVTNDISLGYLTEALELIPGHPYPPQPDIGRLLHFARARYHLEQGNAQAAADDLMLAAESSNRDVQLISVSLGSLLGQHLPDDQANALWQALKPFGFLSSGEMEDYKELFEDTYRQQLSIWHRSLAEVLARYTPRLVPDTPLGTVDLIRLDESRLPTPPLGASPCDLWGRPAVMDSRDAKLSPIVRSASAVGQGVCAGR